MKKIIKTKWSIGLSLLLVMGAVVLISILGFKVGPDYRTSTIVGLSFGKEVDFEQVKISANSVGSFERLEREGNTYNITYLDLDDPQYEELKSAYTDIDDGVSIEKMSIHNVSRDYKQIVYYLPFVVIALILAFWWLLRGTLTNVRVNIFFTLLVNLLLVSLFLAASLSVLSQRVVLSREIVNISAALGVLIFIYGFIYIEHLVSFLEDTPHTKFSQNLDRFVNENWKDLLFSHVLAIALFLPLVYFISSWELLVFSGLLVLIDFYTEVFLFRQVYGLIVTLRNLSFKRFKWKPRRKKK